MNTYAVLLMGDAYQELLADAAHPKGRANRTRRNRISSFIAGLRGSAANGTGQFLPTLKDYPYRG